MIEIGHPFSKPFQDLIDSLEESVREGVEQPALVEILFRKDTLSYEIKGPVHDISRVTGLRRKKFTVFERNLHWRFGSGRLVWQTPAVAEDPDWYPDDNSRVAVEYTFRDPPSGITDFNAGSVAGTMIRAVAREIKLMYEQMDQAYRRAFIDIAEGVALDNVVALMGLVRNQALPAEGFATFFLRKPARDRVVIPPKTRIADAKGRLFLTREGSFIEPELEELARQSGGLVRIRNRIGALTHVRVKGETADLPTRPTAAGKEFGADERIITLDGVAPAGDLLVSYKPKSVSVPILAKDPGPEGNVGSGSITVMPTPPRGVDGGVINEEALTGGVETENDDRLRERAKHELERAGKATLNAIKFSILEVDGVEGVEVIDHAADGSIPLGEVRVRFSGGDPAEIHKAIENSRAAGILVHSQAVTTVFIKGRLFVIPDAGFAADSLTRLKAEIVKTLKGLAIGEAVAVRRFLAAAYQIPGLSDVAEAQLDFAKLKPGESVPSETGVVTDPFAVEPGELIRPDEGNLAVEALAAVKVAGAYSAAAHGTSLSISLLKSDGLPALLQSYRIGITVLLKARLKTAPDQPPQRVAKVEGQIQFAASDTVVFLIPDAAIKDQPGSPGFRLGPDGHDEQVEFQVSATAYPALQAGAAAVDLTGIT